MSLGLQIGLQLGHRQAGAVTPAAFAPSALFAASENGAWYDPSDLSTMFQNSNGTTAAVAGSPVGYIADKSGNGHHLTQATAGLRPILRAGGYLEFDGVDDVLFASFALSQPFDRISAIRSITWVLSAKIYDGLTGVSAGLLYQSNASPELRIYDGGGAAPINGDGSVGANMVVIERHNGAGSRLGINSGAYVTGDTGTNALSGLAVGANSDASQPANIRWYGATLIGRTLTDSEITSLSTYMARKAGVTL